ncbi:MAG TPA: neutral zinc metallopeptidase, partial [Gemmatimonadota bacterium]|nr:neutral zinc metallopeptidase [Gemmatimonadota bacterium]
VGPFYCPRDQQVYIDLDFFRQLRQRFAAPGDFAQAYVIAHEVGHHIQHLTGAMEGFDGYAESGPGSAAVRMELQADCYAGVWAHEQGQRGFLEAGDIEEALTAAAAIGDDNLQRQTQGTVVPESFTHGTADQRVRWFRAGYDAGDPDDCDTFGARAL